VARIGSAHHVLGVEHLLGELWDGEGTVLLASSGGKWSESSHEEVETWEWDKVDSELSEVGVELTWESEAARDTRHSSGDEVVEVTVGWGGELQGSEADVVKGFVVDDHDFIGVFDELMDGEGGVVRLNDGVGDLWGWEDGEGAHHSVWVFFTNLGDEEGSHAGSGSSTEGVGDLESLKAVASFSFLSDYVKNAIDKFCSFGVMSLSPVVSGSSLSEDEVIWSEKLSERSSADGVHGSRLEVHEDGTRNISSSGSFVVVDVDSFKLKIGISVVCSGWVNSMFVRDDFPEFGTDLISALTSLYVNDFSHGWFNLTRNELENLD